METTHKVIIMQGASGSGKSTWLSENVPDALVCSADAYFGPDYDYARARVPAAHRACLRAFVEAITQSVGVVAVDNTNVLQADMAPYVTVALAFGYEVTVVRVNATLEDCVRRNAHGVTPQSITTQLKFMEKPLRRWKARFIEV
jgi:predicted kinase